MNYDYEEKVDETSEEKPSLTKKLSRRVFAVTAGSVNDDNENPDDDADEDADDDQDNDYENENEEEMEEENFDENDDDDGGFGKC